MKPYTAISRGHQIVVDADTMRRSRVHLQAGSAAPASIGIRVFRRFVRLIFGLLFHVRVEGLANVPRHPVIICFNHLGWSEVFLVLLYFPAEPRIM